jgi:release factor glutamine methyltransferase
MGTLGDLLDVAAARLDRSGIPSSRLDAEVLLAHALGASRASLLGRLREPAAPGAPADRFEALLRRREDRVPVPYLTGSREFWSLEFEVGEGVLIPRPETEQVVETALRILREPTRGPGGAPGRPAGSPVVVDAGTGAGPIAVAVAAELPEAVVHATDVSEAALAVARRNAARHGLASRIRFHQGDLLYPVLDLGLEGRVDLVACNPPYVADGEVVQEEVRRWEPPEAVFAGPTGGEVLERLVDQAARALVPGGGLVMEITLARESLVRDLLGARAPGAWRDVEVLPDLAGLPRVAVARRSAAAPRAAEG